MDNVKVKNWSKHDTIVMRFVLKEMILLTKKQNIVFEYKKKRFKLTRVA